MKGDDTGVPIWIAYSTEEGYVDLDGTPGASARRL
jgi:hypothetical protein